MTRFGSWAGRLVGGLALGALTGLLELLILPFSGWAGRGVAGVVGWLGAVERWRLGWLPGGGESGTDGAAGGLGAGAGAAFAGNGWVRRWLRVRWMVGVLGGLVVGIGGWGLWTAGWVVVTWVAGERADGMAPGVGIVAYLAAAGVVLGFLVVQGMVGVAGLERRVVRWAAGPAERDVLRRRIAWLAASRADVVAAVDGERRRIERDLHDGVQQQLVALGMLLGRARRAGDPAELLRDAHAVAGRALTELRDVAWRVYPAVLDEEGLAAALEGVAARSSIPVRLTYDLPTAQPDRTGRTAVYFVVCEAVTNAVKHTTAARVDVYIGVSGSGDDRRLVVRVADDGSGGADPGGVGLSGLARRVAALDGEFTVDSPVGGPTVVRAELPCG